MGHGPFSHLFEPCLGIDHEEWSTRIILEDKQISKILKDCNPYLATQICDLIKEKPDTEPQLWQKALISSQLDVDRIDYLRRDSLFTGSGYGTFDWFRLLNTMIPIEANGNYDIVWPEKSALGIEEYVFARYYMYQNVYIHKTTRGFECLLKEMWKVGKDLFAAGEDVELVQPIKQFWSSETPDINDYMRLEESTVLEQMHVWRTSKNGTLSDLSRRFLCRDGLAMIKPPASRNALQPNNFDEWEQQLKEIVQSSGFDRPESYVLRDELKAKYKRPYISPEREAGEQSIRNSLRIIPDGAKDPIEISEFLPRLKSVTTAEAQVMYYVPKEVREQATNLAKQWEDN